MLVWCSRAADRASRRNRSRVLRSWRHAGAGLQRHAAAERDLLGLVDHAHPAPADLAEDPVVAHLAAAAAGPPAGSCLGRDALGPPRPARPRPGPGTARGSRRPSRGSGRCTPASRAAHRGDTARRTPRPARRTGHNRRSWMFVDIVQIPSQPPGIVARTSLSRFRARKYRLAPASGRIPSTSAVSARLSCSKCFKARTSRSIGSRLFEAFLDAEQPLGALGRLGGRGVPPQKHRGQRR